MDVSEREQCPVTDPVTGPVADQADGSSGAFASDSHWNPWNLHRPVGDPRNDPYPWPAHGQEACCRACNAPITWSSEEGPGSNSPFGRWVDAQAGYLCPAADEDAASRTGSGERFITLSPFPVGRSEPVVSEVRPDASDLFCSDPSAQVWRISLHSPYAEKILDFALASCYLDEDPGNTRVEGERRSHAFHNDLTPQRRLLRAIEARLTLAGFPNAHTSTVGYQLYGLRLLGAADEYMVYEMDEGWVFATRDFYDCERRYLSPGTIAPATASARRVAAAILVRLALRGELVAHAAPLLCRARTRLGVWRITPLWKNVKYHVRERTAYYRRRITTRRPRRR